MKTIVIMEKIDKKILSKEIIDFVQEKGLYDEFKEFMTDKGYDEQEVDELCHKIKEH